MEQQLHDVGVAVGGCLLDCLIVIGVSVCAVVNEKLLDVCMAARTRLPQGRIASSAQVNAVLKERLDNGQTATTSNTSNSSGSALAFRSTRTTSGWPFAQADRSAAPSPPSTFAPAAISCSTACVCPADTAANKARSTWGGCGRTHISPVSRTGEARATGATSNDLPFSSTPAATRAHKTATSPSAASRTKRLNR